MAKRDETTEFYEGEYVYLRSGSRMTLVKISKVVRRGTLGGARIRVYVGDSTYDGAGHRRGGDRWCISSIHKATPELDEEYERQRLYDEIHGNFTKVRDRGSRGMYTIDELRVLRDAMVKIISSEENRRKKNP